MNRQQSLKNVQPYFASALWSSDYAPVAPIEQPFVLSLIDDALDGVTPVADEESPQLRLLVGGVGAGKSTLFAKLASEGAFEFRNQYVLHDPDITMHQLPQFQKAIAEGKTDAWERFELIAYQISMSTLRIAAGSRLNIVAMRTLGSDGLIPIVENLVSERGYKLSLEIIKTPLALSIERATKRAAEDGRSISAEVISLRHYKTEERLPRLKPLAASVREWANVGEMLEEIKY